MDTVIYQQDGATPHCSNASLEYLYRYFPEDMLISRRMDYPWRRPAVCNHAALPGQMHITRLVHELQLRVSSFAG